MIEYDETEFQQGFTTDSLLAIERLLGKEIAVLLYGEVVSIHVGDHPIPILRPPVLPL